MEQTTGGMSGRALYVALSQNGTSWTDVSGQIISIKTDGGERATGTIHTAAGDTPIITEGKLDAISVTLEGVYTEITGEAYALASAAYEADTPLYVRWAPKGNATGNKQFTTAACVVKSPPYQGVPDVGDGKTLVVSIKLETAKITGATIAV